MYVVETTPRSVFTHCVSSVSFGFYTEEEIRAIAVKQITNESTFDAMGLPLTGGVYDPALGPFSRECGDCVTCGLSNFACPGHFGFIDLLVPQYNRFLFSDLKTFLSSICFVCNKFLLRPNVEKQLTLFFKLLEQDQVTQAGEVLRRIELTTAKVTKREERAAYLEILGIDGDEIAMELEEERVRGKAQPADQPQDVAANGKNAASSSKRTKSLGASGASTPSKAKEREEEGKKKSTQTVLDETAREVLRRQDEAVEQAVFGDFEVDDVDDEELLLFKNCNRHQKALKTIGWKLLKSEFKIHKRCPHCDAPRYQIESKPNGVKVFIKKPRVTGEYQMKSGEKLPTNVSAAGSHKLLPSQKAKEILSEAWSNAQPLMDALFARSVDARDPSRKLKSDPSIFFLKLLPVIPNRFRPPSRSSPALGKDQLTFGSISTHYHKILVTLKTLSTHKAAFDKLDQLKSGSTQIAKEITNQLVNLQQLCNSIVNEPDPDKPNGVTQILEKKEGVFRMHLMGKRVNYCARSVISPDPFIGTHEIGVPQYIAKRLTYPEPVTDYNVALMRKLIKNGPDVHPGALWIEDEHGKLQRIPGGEENYGKRDTLSLAIAKPSMDAAHQRQGAKKVHRHLLSGDFLLVNRQPTLHKPGMMGHKARVLKSHENTLRMHYANCNTYNADFDGDEMNLHLPQNELARAELSGFVMNDCQYIGPRDGGPLRGLIQDHVLSGVYLTCKDSFFTKTEFQQLLYSCCHGINKMRKITLSRPAILKPVQLWTGKQVITDVLNHLLFDKQPLNLDSGSQIPAKTWGPIGAEEAEVVIRSNYLCTGILDKKQFGAKSLGIIHCVYELYGPYYSAQLLTMFGRLFTHYLGTRGFTCGIDDLFITGSCNANRKNYLDKDTKYGLSVAAQFTQTLKEGEANMDQLAQAREGEILSKLRTRLHDPEEFAAFDALMIARASKATSAVLDMCQTVHKPFPVNNFVMMTTSGAKGSQVNFSQVACLLGQQELEGKRVPTMANGKTLPSFESFDVSARAGGFVGDRFLTGVRPQEFYFHAMSGREGLIDTAVKTARSGYLQRCIIKSLEGLCVHYDNTVRDSDGAVVQFYYGDDSIDVTKSGYLDQFAFLKLNQHIYRERYAKHFDKFKSLPSEASAVAEDTVMNRFSPSLYSGSVSEKFRDKLTRFIAEDNVKAKQQLDIAVAINEKKATTDKKGSKKAPSEKEQKKAKKLAKKQLKALQANSEEFKRLMHHKFIESLVAPGENVGTCAGQSIGEPSTQMTLNTFHLAGRGEINVTLGVPRLNELLKYPVGEGKSPIMIIPLAADVTLQQAEKYSAMLSPLRFSDWMQRIRCSMIIRPDSTRHLKRFADVEFAIDYPVKSGYSKFLRGLLLYIDKCLGHLMEKKRGKAAKGEAAEGGSQEDGADELLSVKAKKKQAEQEDEEEDEADRKSKSKTPKKGAATPKKKGKAESSDEESKSRESKSSKKKESSKKSKKSEKKSKRKKRHSSDSSGSDENDESEEDAKQKTTSYSSEDEESGENLDIDEDEDEASDDDSSEASEKSVEEMEVEGSASKKKSASSSKSSEKKKSSEEKGERSKKSKKASSSKSSKSDAMDAEEEEELDARDDDGEDIDEIEQPVTEKELFASVRVDKGWVADKYQKLLQTYGSILQQLDLSVDKQKKRFRVTLSLMFKVSQTPAIVPTMTREAGIFYLSNCKNIKRALTLKPDRNNKNFRVQTQGIDLGYILSTFSRDPNVLLNEIQANNPSSIAQTYGIEAARIVLIRELENVFNVYGIDVNRRHLSMIGDYMTNEGELKGFTRQGLKDTPSPLQKISYEASMSHLADSCLFGEIDRGASPSARLVLGTPMTLGSGSFEVRQPVG